MKPIIPFIGLLLLALSAPGQKPLRYSAQQYGGLLIGGNGISGQVQTIHGIRVGPWLAGAGAGIDWYYTRSVPAFLFAERGFAFGGNRRIYLSGLAGPNFPWKQKWTDFSGGNYHYRPGLYWSSGIGYRIPFGKNSDAFLFHLGFSQKTYREEVTTVVPCLIPPCPESTERYKYNLRNISVKMGWGF